MNEIRTGLFRCRHDLSVNIAGFVERQVSQRLQQSARGRDVSPHEDLPPFTGIRRSLPGISHCSADDLLHRIAGPFQLQPVGTEHIGQENIASRCHILPLHILNVLRPRNIPYVCIFSRDHPLLLQHASHAAVKKQDSCSQYLCNFFCHFYLFLL